MPRILIEPGRSLVGNAGVTAYEIGTVKEIPGVRTYLSVDGGMSDNLRPMLYGSRYEAVVANRAAAAPDTLATVAGMHCESGDILITDVLLADPAPGRRAGDAGHRRLRLRDGQQLQRRARARRSSSAGTETRGWSCVARPGTTWWPAMSTEVARIGLLGLGTVGSAFRELVSERAEAIAAASGRRPEIVGVLRSTEGDFDRILESSEIVVELIGGTDPARDYVLRALRAGRHVVTANKQLIAQFGDELFDAARDAGVELRFEAAVAGVVPVIRVIQESLAATEITKVFGIVNGTTNFILSEMASTGASFADALRRAQELGYAEADPTDDVDGADAAAKMAILAGWPSARRWRSPTSPMRGSPRSSPTTSPTRGSSACR